jgi:hypothetical protein
MAVVLLGAWAFLCAYVGVWRKDRMSLKLGLAGAIGFGVGFPLAAWIQGAGPATGIPVDWWKVAEHMIGWCGGIGLGVAALSLESTWNLPLTVRPWERWLALVWLLWFLPAWLISNNLDYWITERAYLPVGIGKWVWGGLVVILLGLGRWGWMEIQRGRTFVTSWLPHHLRAIYLTFLWLTTLIAITKTVFNGGWSPTSMVFLILSTLVTGVLLSNRTAPSSTERASS